MTYIWRVSCLSDSPGYENCDETNPSFLEIRGSKNPPREVLELISRCTAEKGIPCLNRFDPKTGDTLKHSIGKIEFISGGKAHYTPSEIEYKKMEFQKKLDKLF